MIEVRSAPVMASRVAMRRTSTTMIAYRQPTAAASVGVMMPP